ncbi:GNAT family N-acetyltransferase [Psychrobacillus sp. NPDC058041]|uniref:GNAT family N-acetyltransferase n=1 Tax=Psychrobacillus sp. NPDC058041 TaxID=3346310 RepID=UPI0036DCE9B9
MNKLEKFKVKRIQNLITAELVQLVEESKQDGFRFLERLVNEFENGTNTFTKPGEYLYGVYMDEGKLIAVGGLNRDPYSNNQNIGRLRRFYVAKEYRRSGVGKLLLNEIISDAKNYFEIIVLHTDTEQATKFYSAFGFKDNCTFPDSTHYLNLGRM